MLSDLRFIFRYALTTIALLLLLTETSEGSRAKPVELILQGNSSFVTCPVRSNHFSMPSDLCFMFRYAFVITILVLLAAD
jgi:hypothetical protein